MKKSFLLILISAFLINACGKYDSSSSKTFDWKLRGTWVSNDPSVYSGRLIIEYNRITIWGYDEAQTLLLGDDTKLPFKNFPKGIPFEGYSEDGVIYIMRGSTMQDGVPYIYQSVNYDQYRLLYITFGGREEILIRLPDSK